MSSRIFQSVIVQMKEATDRMIGVIDADSNVISCSDTSLIGEKWPEAVIRLNSAPDSIVVVDKKTFKPLVSWSAYFDYAVFAEGDDEIARSLCVMAYVALNGAKTYYEEKHDKGTFVKNIITDNILPGDVYIRAKELHFVTDVPRAVFLIRQVGRADVASVDVVAGMFPDRQQDFVLSINETDIAVVKQIQPNTERDELIKIAQTIEQTLHTELFIKTVIGIGTVASHLRELADSFKEAQVAIEVGKVFDTEKTIINYENLGIGNIPAAFRPGKDRVRRMHPKGAACGDNRRHNVRRGAVLLLQQEPGDAGKRQGKHTGHYRAGDSRNGIGILL